MRIQLPVETWIEILDWLRRRDMIKKLDKLWDRQFTPIVQDWLHKYTRNVKIGDLMATKYGLRVRVGNNWEEVPFADVKLPENITSFMRITVNSLHSNVLTLLRQMRPLFHNIHLRIDDKFEEKYPPEAALCALMPMINIGLIETISLDCNFLKFFSVNYPSTLSNAKVLNILEYYEESDRSKQILVDWLFTKRDDGHVRILDIFWTNGITGLYEKIREHFLDSARQFACPFFVKISICSGELTTTMPDNENGRTGEQLIFGPMEYDENHNGLLIANLPKNTNLEWLERNMKIEKQQVIRVDMSPEISNFGTFDFEDDDAENAEEAT